MILIALWVTAGLATFFLTRYGHFLPEIILTAGESCVFSFMAGSI